MQYGQKTRGCLTDRFAPNSQYYCNYDNGKLYIKQSSIQGKNISVISISNPQQTTFSPNSQFIAVLIRKNNCILIYKVSDGTLVAKIQDNLAGITSFFWCQDSTQIVAISQNNLKCSIYILHNQTVQYIKNPKFNTEKGYSFTQDGKFLALLEKHDCKDFLNVYHTQSWNMVNSFQLNELFDAAEVCWMPNDSFILVWDNCINYRMLVFCPLKGQVTKYEPYNYALGIKSVRPANSNDFIAIGSYDEKIRLLNALTWKFIGEIDFSNTTINTNQVKVYKEEDMNNHGNIIKLMQNAGNYKVPTVKVVNNEKGSPNQGISLIQFSHDDSFIACRNDNMPYTTFIFSASSLTLHTVISLNNHTKMFKWIKNQNKLCLVSGTDRLLFWKDDLIVQCDFKFQNQPFNIQKIKLSSDGNKMLMMDKNGTLVFAQFDQDDQYYQQDG